MICIYIYIRNIVPDVQVHTSYNYWLTPILGCLPNITPTGTTLQGSDVAYNSNYNFFFSHRSTMTKD